MKYFYVETETNSTFLSIKSINMYNIVLIEKMPKKDVQNKKKIVYRQPLGGAFFSILLYGSTFWLLMCSMVMNERKY